MHCTNFNLLGTEDLARLGFSPGMIAQVEANRPFDSVLDLALLPGIGVRSVRRLLAQGVIAGLQDRAFLPAGVSALPPDLFLLRDDGDDEDEGGGEEDPDRTATLPDGGVYAMEPGGPAVTIDDCTTSVTRLITATGAEVKRAPGEAEAAVFQRARDAAELALGLALARIGRRSKCTNGKCMKVSLGFGPTGTFIGRRPVEDPQTGQQDLFVKATIKQTVTVSCVPA